MDLFRIFLLSLATSNTLACDLIRFSLLHDGRCLTAQPGLKNCGVSLAPCAEAGEAFATWQAWRLQPSEGGSFLVHSPAKAKEDGGFDPTCVDESLECAAWAVAVRYQLSNPGPLSSLFRLSTAFTLLTQKSGDRHPPPKGECAANPSYMRASCRRACGQCQRRRACFMWSHRTPPLNALLDGDPALARGIQFSAPILSLATNRTSRRDPSRRMRVQLSLWSAMFPDHRFLHATCPQLPNAACCLEAGQWFLGPRNAGVKRAQWQLCSFHEVHMFAFQQWRVECASAAADHATGSSSADGSPGSGGGASSSGGSAAAQAAAARTVAWLEGLVEASGVARLSRLLPFELLGIGEFASLDEAKLAFRSLSRLLHPDKATGPHATLLYDAVRTALELFKSGSWREAAQADADSRFFLDDAIVELNRTEHAAVVQSDGPLWLIIYFAPWCHQCLANRAYFHLTALKLRELLGDQRVRVGALRCGVPREAGGWCETELSVFEHPTFRAVARGFASELGPSLPQPLLPELLVNFTLGEDLGPSQDCSSLARTAPPSPLAPTPTLLVPTPAGGLLRPSEE